MATNIGVDSANCQVNEPTSDPLLQRFITWLRDAAEQVARAEVLKSAPNSPDQPYRTMYEAIEIEQRLLKQLQQLATEYGIDSNDDDGSKKASQPKYARFWLSQFVLLLSVGVAHHDTEDTSAAEQCFKTAANLAATKLNVALFAHDPPQDPEAPKLDDENEKILHDYMIVDGSEVVEKYHPTLSLLLIQLVNQIAYFKCLRGDYQQAIPWLRHAELIYYTWKKSSTPPLCKEDLIAQLDINDAHTIEQMVNDLIKQQSQAQLPETTNARQVPVVGGVVGVVVASAESRQLDIDKAHTMTTYFLAQAYEQLGQYMESARYCHQTLRSQYPMLDLGILPQVDRVDWALNAATLAQYFAANDQYSVAKHLICCAQMVWRDGMQKREDEKKKKKEEKLKTNGIELKLENDDQNPKEITEKEEDEEEHEGDERWKKAGADLDRIDVKYCLMLLDDSYQLITKHANVGSNKKSYEFKAFLLNEPEKLSQEESKLPTFPLCNYDEAKRVFTHAISLIERAKCFFTLTDRASDYVDCTIDHCAIYRAIAQYDPSKDRDPPQVDTQCKLLKRQIDLLESLVEQLSPQHYMAELRKAHYELGDLYQNLVTYKIIIHGQKYSDSLRSGDVLRYREITSSWNKINVLVAKAIDHFHQFQLTFVCIKSNKNNPSPSQRVPTLADFDGDTALLKATTLLHKFRFIPLPKRIEPEDAAAVHYIQPILTSYLAIGRLFTKFTAFASIQSDIDMWNNCAWLYGELQKYLQHNTDHKEEYFQQYAPELEQMLTLIPGKINVLHQELLRRQSSSISKQK